MIWQWSVSTSQTLLGGKGFSTINLYAIQNILHLLMCFHAPHSVFLAPRNKIWTHKATTKATIQSRSSIPHGFNVCKPYFCFEFYWFLCMCFFFCSFYLLNCPVYVIGSVNAANLPQQALSSAMMSADLRVGEGLRPLVEEGSFSFPLYLCKC